MESGSAPGLRVTGQKLNCNRKYFLLNTPLCKLIGVNRIERS